MSLKVGQIYQNQNLKVAITFIGNGFVRSQQVQCISPQGFTYGWSFAKAERYLGNLISRIFYVARSHQFKGI